MLGLLQQNPLIFLLVILSLVVAIAIHEFAHAYMANRLGDPTPRINGRLTLNPLAHLDPLGTLLIVVAGFGWGKPVMFDPYNLENPKRDAMLIALAGPVSNLILATLLALVIRLALASSYTLGLFSSVLVPAIQLNVMLAIFNLVPVHPLDGGKILIGLLPQDLALEADDLLRRYGMFLLLLLIIPISGVSAISSLISPPISFITSWLLP